jgi:hypothetical protein
MGEGVSSVDCHIVAIDKGDQPYLVLVSESNNLVEAIEFDGNSYSIARTLPIEELVPSSIRVTHYLGPHTITYTGLRDFALGDILRIPRLQLFLRERLEKVDQYLFNRRKLATKQRNELLGALVKHAVAGQRSFSSIDLMTHLYSIKWVLHPDAESEQSKLEFFLDSLVATGELELRNHEYWLTGHALKTLEDSEEDDRRHVENVKLQRRMFWLTLVIVLLTMAQAGLIRLPTILDISK